MSVFNIPILMATRAFGLLVLISTLKFAGCISFNNSVVWASNLGSVYYTDGSAQQWIDEPPPDLNSILFAQSVFGFAYDYHNNLMVLSHPEEHMLTVFFLESEYSTVFYLGTSKDVGQLTIDWKARNVYWADAGFGWIAMKPLPESSTFNSLSQSFRIVVDKYLDNLTGIKVHPEKYYLFWADAGSKPKIERSNLVGEERKVIVWFNLMYPVCLTIDSATDRLYWSDQSRGTIEYTDFDGNNRKILVSHSGYNYYGVAVFQESLFYTIPNQNQSGFYSLRENVIGQIGSYRRSTFPLYFVDIFNLESQPRDVIEGCDSVHLSCSQICLHTGQDRGASCYCEDGFSLHAGDGKTCNADSTVLERHLLFTNDTTICSIGVNIINEAQLLDVDCNVVRHNTSIRVFAVDMARSEIFFSSDWSIFSVGTHGHSPQIRLLIKENTEVTDIDYNWRTSELFWIIQGGRDISYMTVTDAASSVNTQTMESEVTNIAVDTHNRRVFYIIYDGATYSLYAWYRDADSKEQIHTVHLQNPSDLEYDRQHDRLVWNDDSGHVGVIYTNGTGERRISTQTTGEDRHAVIAFKNYIITTTSEDNRFIDSIYDRDGSQNHITFDPSLKIQRPITDIRVFDTTLQSIELEPCELDNGGCAQICIPDVPHRCSCYLGYQLQPDDVTCSTAPLQSDYFLVLDSQSAVIYQTAEGSRDDDIRAVTINSINKPSSIAIDFSRDIVAWVDGSAGLVKQKHLHGSSEMAFGTNVDRNSDIAIDITNGNIYIASGRTIYVLDEYNHVKTIVESRDIEGTPARIALLSEKGFMAWVEQGSRSRVVLANMDGSNVRAVRDSAGANSDVIRHPDDLAFDIETKSHLYWCDSDLDKIEKITITSAAAEVLYSGVGLYPVTLDVAGQFIYFIPKYQRKIYQISTDGTGIKLITESPLFGQLTHLVAFKSTLNPHNACADCNGGCSSLCLSRGTSLVCACGSGTTLTDDGRTCTTDDRCPVPTVTFDGLQEFTGCCMDHPHAECKPVCQSGYALQHGYLVKCVNGRWNVTEICKGIPDADNDDGDDTSVQIPLIAGGAGGAAAVIVIVIVVIVVCKRKGSSQKRRPSMPPDWTELNSISGPVSSSPNGHPMTGLHPPPLPDRDLTPAEQADGGEYTYLDDVLIVDLPDKNKYENGDVQDIKKKKNNYTKFPNKDPNYGYLTAAYNFTPNPDYPYCGGANDNDGYLVASSFSGTLSRKSDFNDDYPRLRVENTDLKSVVNTANGRSGITDGNSMVRPKHHQQYESQGSLSGFDGPRFAKQQQQYESQGSLSGFDSPAPRNARGEVLDQPPAHFRHMHGSGSGTESDSSPYKSKISRF